MARAVILGGLHPDGLREIAARDDVHCAQHEDPDDARIAELVRDADGILAHTQPLTAAALDGAENLKVVSRHGVGFDSVDMDALNRRRIPLALTIHANRNTVAEQAMALLLALAKHVRACDRAVREGDWNLRHRLESWELDGRTLLLVGCGRAGGALAARALAFGMRVLAHDPYAKPPAGVGSAPTLEEGLRQADVVSLHAPLTGATRHMMDAAAFASVKPGAVLINTARGGLVDEAALSEALDSGAISAAGLDTFEREPPDLENPLLERDNVVTSPHVAGVSSESMRRMGVESARNLLAGIDGTLDPEALANPEVLAVPQGPPRESAGRHGANG